MAPLICMLSRPMAMPRPWIAARPTVPKRVYWVIFFRPASPSFCSFSRAGTTTAKSCRMMEDDMYGMIPRANTDRRRSAPPENRSKKPRRFPPCCWKKSASA